MISPKLLVIDSSVAVKWLNSQGEDNISQADKILKDTQKGDVSLVAPELAKYEIGNALLNKKMTIPEVLISLTTLYSFPITFVKLDENDAAATYEVAFNHKMTFYDATFVHLADKINASLVTANPKHQKRLSGVKVIPLEKYK